MVSFIDPEGIAIGQDYSIAHRGSNYQVDRSKLMEALAGASSAPVAPPPIDPAVEMIDTLQTPIIPAPGAPTATAPALPATTTALSLPSHLIDLGDGLFTTQDRLMAAAGQWLDATRPRFPLELGGAVVRLVELVLSADGAGFALTLVREGQE